MMPGLTAQHPIIPDQSPSVKPILQSMAPSMTNDAQKSPNPFQILGIEPTFTTSPDQIQHAYLQKLSTAHPDLVSQNATSDSPALDPATLNQARDTLLNDEARANLMLQLAAGPSPKDKSLPDGFLMHMMELRTQIEEELQTDPTEARPRWQSWTNDERTKTIATITTLFNQIQADPTAANQIKQDIRTHLNAWRYTERLIEQLDPTYHPSTTDF